MGVPKLTIAALSILVLLPSARAGKEVDRLLKEYSRINTVSCRMRRTVEQMAGKVKFLSRVYYTNKDQLHAENLTPIKRRTIADGTRLYQYGEGDPKGFSRPVEGLSEQMILHPRPVVRRTLFRVREARAVKRRRKNYHLMTKPRHEMVVPKHRNRNWLNKREIA